MAPSNGTRSGSVAKDNNVRSFSCLLSIGHKSISLPEFILSEHLASATVACLFIELPVRAILICCDARRGLSFHLDESKLMRFCSRINIISYYTLCVYCREILLCAFTLY